MHSRSLLQLLYTRSLSKLENLSRAALHVATRWPCLKSQPGKFEVPIEDRAPVLVALAASFAGSPALGSQD